MTIKDIDKLHQVQGQLDLTELFSEAKGSINETYAEIEDTKVVSYTKTYAEHPVSGVRGSTLLGFHSIVAVTKEYAVTQGAILFEFIDPDTGEIEEIWIPKSIMSNLSLDDNTVWVWDKFLASAEEDFSRFEA